MRQILLLLAGLLVGALLAFSAANSLRLRQAWPRGVMAVLQQHTGQLRRLQRAGRCDAAVTAAHFRLLAVVASDIEPAYSATASASPDFHDQALALIRQLETLHTSPPSDCTALDQQLPRIQEACDGCHRDYR